MMNNAELTACLFWFLTSRMNYYFFAGLPDLYMCYMNFFTNIWDATTWWIANCHTLTCGYEMHTLSSLWIFCLLPDNAVNVVECQQCLQNATLTANSL